MTGLVDWAASRARMVLAFIALSILAGAYAYGNLPKEGEPDIEIPALFGADAFERGQPLRHLFPAECRCEPAVIARDAA